MSINYLSRNKCDIVGTPVPMLILSKSFHCVL